MKLVGTLLLVFFALLGGYALLFFDPTVSAGSYSVINLHKLSFQHNLLIVAGMGAVVAVILVVFGGRPKASDAAVAGGVPFAGVSDANLEVEDAFASAIRKNDSAAVRRSLETRSVSSHGRNRNGRGWLQYATAFGSIESCRILMEFGASPTDPDDLGTTAAAEAATHNHFELVVLFRSAVESRTS